MINFNNIKMEISQEERDAYLRLKSLKGKYKSLYIKQIDGMICLCEIRLDTLKKEVIPKVCITGVEADIIKSVLQFMSKEYAYTLDDILYTLGGKMW